MARGFVRKRGDRWYAYWRDPSGRQRSKAVSSRKKDAERFLAEIEGKLATGSYRELKEALFSEFADRWADDYAAANVKPSTLASYKSIIEHSLVPTFDDLRLADIRTEDVQRFVAQKIKSGAAPGTARKHLVVLSTILKHAVLWGYLIQNPADAVKPPKTPHSEMDF